MKTRRPRARVILVTLGVTMLILGAAGFLYIRTSDWWITVTLFSDDTRADNFRAFHTLFPADPVGTGADTWEFEPRAQSQTKLPEMPELPNKFSYDGASRDVEGFLRDTWTTGLAVSVDGTIVVEEYYRGYAAESLPTSFSMAKSVLSALVGIAIDQGSIESVHDPVERYLPAFAGTDYGTVTLHHLLTMSSGLGFDEDYESFTSDINMLPVQVFGFQDPLPELLIDTEAVREPGVYNEYISSDSLVLGLVVEAAVGTSLSRFLQEALWKPAGMEFPAHWNTDYHGNTLGHAFFSASVRDYLRFGRLYLNQGRRGDRQIIPEQWVQRSIRPTEPHLQPGANPDSHWTFGYGYQWWIPENPQGDFTAIGIWGQYIYVHPEYNVVIVKTSADEHFDGRDHETIALFRHLARWAAGQD